MGTLVMKFGGMSLGTTTALTQVLSIVLHENERWDKLLLVVSALEGVTDALVEAAQLAQLSNRRGYRRITATLRTRHLALIEALPLGTTERQAIQADVDRLLFEMLDMCQSIASNPTEGPPPKATDKIIGVGERLSARIVASLLRQNRLRGVAIDTNELIITDNVFGNATPNIELSRERIDRDLMPMLSRDIIPVITGFIGSTPDGNLTTLGRGGSDYTASVVGLCCEADEVWMWTDVDGMMSTDPRDIPEARVIPLLSYEEVAEMAYFGARVLHARMIGPLQQAEIPLRIKNVYKPQQTGTLIFKSNPKQTRTIKGVTSIPGLWLTTDHSGPLTDIIDIVNKTLTETVGSHADVMISSQSSSRSVLCFIIPTSAGPGALRNAINGIQHTLQNQPTVQADWNADQVSVITGIGSFINEIPDQIAKAIGSVNKMLGMSLGPSNCSFSVIVQVEQTEDVLKRLHDLILDQ